MRRSEGVEPTESDARLNKLIEEYRAENERCTEKIAELKQRLTDQTEARGPIGSDKIYAKSFKVTSDRMMKRSDLTRA